MYEEPKRQRPRSGHLSATSLKLDPGAGLAPPHEVSRAAWGGGRMIKPTRPARPVTDQGQLCIRPVLGQAGLDLINEPRERDNKTSAAAVALAISAREASPPISLSYQRIRGRISTASTTAFTSSKEARATVATEEDAGRCLATRNSQYRLIKVASIPARTAIGTSRIVMLCGLDGTPRRSRIARTVAGVPDSAAQGQTKRCVGRPVIVELTCIALPSCVRECSGAWLPRRGEKPDRSRWLCHPKRGQSQGNAGRRPRPTPQIQRG